MNSSSTAAAPSAPQASTSAGDAEKLAAWQADPMKGFEIGVWNGIHLWDTLMLAVDNGWAGRNAEGKVDELYNMILDLFEESK